LAARPCLERHSGTNDQRRDRGAQSRAFGDAAEQPFTRSTPERAYDEKPHVRTRRHLGKLHIWHATEHFLRDTRTGLSQSDGVLVQPIPDRSGHPITKIVPQSPDERLVPDMGKNQRVAQAPRDGRRRSTSLYCTL
jgi:hypothetical protein